MKVRFVFPTVTANGLGNNIITLAKAHLIAESCQLSYQPPVWPFCEHVKPQTKNGYGYYFPTGVSDSLKLGLTDFQKRVQRKLGVQLWPIVPFQRKDYEHSGIIDVGDACKSFLEQRGLDDPGRSLVMTTSGMWCGYAGINRAREWITNLFLSHLQTRRRLEEIEGRCGDRLRVAVQIRMGDFVDRTAAGPIKEGERVVRLPLEWYSRVCRLIRAVCDCDFILVSDGSREELAEFLDEFRPISTIGEPHGDLLGALLLSRSDLVLCSNSTYSRLGCFLNDRPYIWPADTLFKHPNGRFGYLLEYERNRPLNGDKSDPDAVRRCFALRVGFSGLPDGLSRYLESQGTLPIESESDLLYYDPVPIF